MRLVGSFTVEPLGDGLGFWGEELGWEVAWEFAGFGQVFQELLSTGDAGGPGARVVLVRLADWLTDPAGADGGCEWRLMALVDELVEAVRVAARSAPVVAVVCPSPSPAVGLVAAAEDRLMEQAAGLPGVVVVPSRRLSSWYPDLAWHEPYADRVGRVPYTPAGYAALATVVARGVHACVVPRPKVIAVDCDGTLWDGVVGELGVDGVTVSAARRQVQRLLVNQVAAGRLLCLCSRNDDRDVMAVLREHPEMLLRPEHVTAVRVNWEPKPANLRSLAAELELGLDSFLFLDDDPVQVAQVRASLPQVAALRLPADAVAAVSFLDHCWPLDAVRVTTEDTQRTVRYREQRLREHARTQATTLAEFLDRLDLTVTIRPAVTGELDRVAQLTARTNQFNLTGAVRTVADLSGHVDRGSCLVVEVTDRFGDYGLVGAMTLSTEQPALVAGTFLLSCRALGRGVEHRMLAHLGALATEQGLGEVRLPYVSTGRNQPAHRFLTGLPGDWRDGDDGRHLILPSSCAAATRYDPSILEPESVPRQAGTQSPARVSPPAPSGLIDHIATDLATPAQIVAAIGSWRKQHATASDGYRSPAEGLVPPRTPAETAVMRLWADLLTPPPQSIHDNFFELSGDSLKLVQFMSQVRKHFGIELPASTLFESTLTIAEIAAAIEQAQQATPAPDADDIEALAGRLRDLPDDQLHALFEGADD
jgi:FkbH-like protein